MWCHTSQHGLALWDWRHALDEDSDLGAVPYYTATDIRPLLTHSHINQAFPGQLHQGHVLSQVDYLLGCFERGAALTLACGNGSGGVGLFDVVTASNPSESRKQTAASTEDFRFGQRLTGGHSDIVRCFLPWSADRWLTGGEDSRICIWEDRSIEGQEHDTGNSRVVTKERERSRQAPY